MASSTKDDALARTLKQTVARVVQQCDTPGVWWLAFSGGLDSTVLLHLLADYAQSHPLRLRALHVHHGLHVEADAWAAACAFQCEQLHIPLQILRVQVNRARGTSLEAEAREARYAALQSHMKTGDRLVTAQHADDQAETVLLQLLRGAGLAGLSGMPIRRVFGPGFLVRPLLTARRASLEAYARAQGLAWLDDASNQDEDIERNFLRHRVMPLLGERWPGYAVTMPRSAAHIAAAEQELRAISQTDLLHCLDEQGRVICEDLQAYSPERQRRLLRRWIEHGARPAATAAQLERILHEVVPAAEDALPLVAWPGAEVRRYQGKLWLSPPLPAFQAEPINWDPASGPLSLPGGLGMLSATGPNATGKPLTVTFRATGEKCTPVGRRTTTLKKLMQDLAFPPWLRDRVPLVVRGGAIVSVADRTLCRGHEAYFEGLRWQRPAWWLD